MNKVCPSLQDVGFSKAYVWVDFTQGGEVQTARKVRFLGGRIPQKDLDWLFQEKEEFEKANGECSASYWSKGMWCILKPLG